MKVKVCGVSTLEQVETCVKFGASFCGFILNYPKSHRYISFEKAKELTNFNKGETKYVGVLVNPNNDELKKFSNKPKKKFSNLMKTHIKRRGVFLRHRVMQTSLKA